MIEFPVMRSHENPKRAKYELWKAVTGLEQRGFEVTQPMKKLDRLNHDSYFKNDKKTTNISTYANRVVGHEYQTYFVKMRSVES